MPIPTSPFWKFRTVDVNTIKMLVNKQLWFSHPSKFNDPFDTQISLVDYLEEITGTVPLKDIGAFTQASRKYLPFHERYLETRFLYCVNQQKDGFNPFEEVLMWSHYADEHRGICIGLSMNSVRAKLPTSFNFEIERAVIYGPEEFAQQTVSEVNGWYSNSIYKQEYYRLNSVKIYDIDFRKEAFFTVRLFDSFSFVKSRNWSYENEYRFALDNIASGKSSGALVGFDSTDLENVIFGLLTPQSDKDTIMHLLASPEWVHVKVWQAKRGAGIFKLEFERLK
jgi:hypothetical protein